MEAKTPLAPSLYIDVFDRILFEESNGPLVKEYEEEVDRITQEFKDKEALFLEKNHHPAIALSPGLSDIGEYLERNRDDYLKATRKSIGTYNFVAHFAYVYQHKLREFRFRELLDKYARLNLGEKYSSCEREMNETKKRSTEGKRKKKKRILISSAASLGLFAIFMILWAVFPAAFGVAGPAIGFPVLAISLGLLIIGILTKPAVLDNSARARISQLKYAITVAAYEKAKSEFKIIQHEVYAIKDAFCQERKNTEKKLDEAYDRFLSKLEERKAELLSSVDPQARDVFQEALEWPEELQQKISTKCRLSKIETTQDVVNEFRLEKLNYDEKIYRDQQIEQLARQSAIASQQTALLARHINEQNRTMTRMNAALKTQAAAQASTAASLDLLNTIALLNFFKR